MFYSCNKGNIAFKEQQKQQKHFFESPPPAGLFWLPVFPDIWRSLKVYFSFSKSIDFFYLLMSCIAMLTLFHAATISANSTLIYIELLNWKKVGICSCKSLKGCLCGLFTSADGERRVKSNIGFVVPTKNCLASLSPKHISNVAGKDKSLIFPGKECSLYLDNKAKTFPKAEQT